ncbi:LytR C-terminal domain-containing protein [Paractinoplanes brasiliensis]|uniref:LytR cell envelope-related transcriptional attenuator n=1 Tax=Paractinoplanes brasiliensis TaxID=52695 RepID=A0A4R6JVS6_9ACTN|nr:LytR C-terminal domain-containing protein [Actinoplanes brasiliensis]TDO40860.1 LytR cell envelope-related transcriptional attenuator [Actinoplanes brasiliensis]
MSFARVRALIVVGVLALAAVVFVVVALVRDTQGGTNAGEDCPAGAPLADLGLPDDPAEVSIKVYNGTDKPGLADSVTNEFKNRRFTTQKPAESKTKYKGVAEIRYGPEAVGKAQLLRAYFLAQSKMSYSAKRKGQVIDIVIGNEFRQLATTTEVNQSLVEVGEPTLPPGSCLKPAEKAKDS